jgi:hypothetical protein
LARSWDHHTLPEGPPLYTTALCALWNIHTSQPGVRYSRYVHGERRVRGWDRYPPLGGNAPPKQRDAKEEVRMPLYMDHHMNLEGLTAEAVAEDHKKDLEVQDKHGAKALRYWFNEEKGEVYCLFEAPNAEAAEAVHREAHGNVADEIIEVEEGS